MYAQADPQLVECIIIKVERAVTWDDLKTRPPLFPGVEGGIGKLFVASGVKPFPLLIKAAFRFGFSFLCHHWHSRNTTSESLTRLIKRVTD